MPLGHSLFGDYIWLKKRNKKQWYASAIIVASLLRKARISAFIADTPIR